jgi:hypothetical protein
MRRVHHMRLRTTLLAAVIVLIAGRGWAQTASPIFHGVLGITPAVGKINLGEKSPGIGNIKIKRWDLVLRPDSNGVSPTTEQIIIAIGDSERLVVQAGTVKSSRNGKRFTFNDSKTTRGVRSLKIVQYTKGCIGLACYKVSFSLVAIDFSSLVLESPVCTPTAIIIGDDDGFSGVLLTRPGLVGTTIRVQSACSDVNNWPWLS